MQELLSLHDVILYVIIAADNSQDRLPLTHRCNATYIPETISYALSISWTVVDDLMTEAVIYYTVSLRAHLFFSDFILTDSDKIKPEVNWKVMHYKLIVVASRKTETLLLFYLLLLYTNFNESLATKITKLDFGTYSSAHQCLCHGIIHVFVVYRSARENMCLCFQCQLSQTLNTLL